jgi:G3E family GTPase
VIENEFGEGLSIESFIARDGMDDSSASKNLADLIELPNGCICCTVKDSLVLALENLLSARHFQNVCFDYILIECSGLVNPGPLAGMFWLDAALESRLRLDGIITVVDATNIQRQLRDTKEAAQQIAYADRILLNKMDLLMEQDNNNQQHDDDLTQTLRSINPTAPIRPTQFSAVPDLDWILDARCFDPDRLSANQDETLVVVGDTVAPTTTATAPQKDDAGDEYYCQDCVDPSVVVVQELDDCDPHTHTNKVTSLSLVRSGHVDLARMHAWLATLLSPDTTSATTTTTTNHGVDDDTSSVTAQELFRIKGILAVRCDDDNSGCGHEDPRRHVVQAVYDLWEIHPGSSEHLQWQPEEERRCHMVLIGRGLQEQELRRGFYSCFC